MHRFLNAAWLAALIFSGGGAQMGRAEESSPTNVEFFEKRIRPVLAESCYGCHSASSDKIRAGLRLDSREAILKGGDSGPAAVPADPEHSLLIRAIRYTDPDLQMPPKKGKLSERRIEDFVAWVRDGLAWPTEESGGPAQAKRGLEISERDRSHWAFRAIQRPALPHLKSSQPLGTGVDAFILAQLESKNLEPNAPASRRELIRRVYFDLIGLPPPPSEVEAFDRDSAPEAYEQLVDRLLARPEYGERWARHWLDVVRYAQSNGYERDGEKPLAWRYRDYVVRSFNDDKPYDRFVQEQIAGDELPDATADSVVATGFLRLGVWDDEPDDRLAAEYDELDDCVSTTGTTFLGLTLGCARCHDHKFDPISQNDYYQFLAFFRQVRPNDNPRYALDSPNYLPLAPPAQVRAWENGQAVRRHDLQSQVACAVEGPDKRALQKQLDKLQADSGPWEWALAVREETKPLPTHVLIRGNPRSPGPEVRPGFLTVLGGGKPALPSPGTQASSTGRRVLLARWLGSSTNPLTARVLVNRVWQHHFGQGLVKTTGDFGRVGTPPTHPELLDWLASEFMDSGWSLKRLHRLILLSRTYQMSSRSDNALAQSVDPGDDLLWRQRLHRLEAESIWDALLNLTGELNPRMGGRGFFPRLAGEVLAGESRPGLDWEISSPAEGARRSIYMFIRRTMLVPILEAFDYSTTSSPLPERPLTTVAPQALMLLNSDWVQERAKVLAARIASEGGANALERVQRAYRVALGRRATSDEVALAVAFIERQQAMAAKVRTRLTFRPDVPSALFADYLKQLPSTEFLRGPARGWNYYRGRWSDPYEGIRTMDRSRGPFALWQGEPFADGIILSKLFLHAACESASLFLRARAVQDEPRGYELFLDPRHGRVGLLRHAEKIVELGHAPASVKAGELVSVRVELAGPRFCLWLGPGALTKGEANPVLDVTDPAPLLEPGAFGVRAYGAALSLDDSNVVLTGRTMELSPETPTCSGVGASAFSSEAERRAWQSFCLLLINLNEFVYVD